MRRSTERSRLLAEKCHLEEAEDPFPDVNAHAPLMLWVQEWADHLYVQDVPGLQAVRAGPARALEGDGIRAEDDREHPSTSSEEGCRRCETGEEEGNPAPPAPIRPARLKSRTVSDPWTNPTTLPGRRVEACTSPAQDASMTNGPWKRTSRATPSNTWLRALVGDLALVMVVGASDRVLGHSAAAFSTVVALAVIVRRR
jgi:hypothetical protein